MASQVSRHMVMIVMVVTHGLDRTTDSSLAAAPPQLPISLVKEFYRPRLL